MLFNYIRNKKMYEKYGEKNTSYADDGSLIEETRFKAKNNDIFIILHVQYADENGDLTLFGEYEILNNKEKRIGYLKYVFFDADNSDAWMQLSDIHFDFLYRNIGIGSKVLELFEQRAHNYGAVYIEGTLSSVDEKTEYDKVLRDTFYRKSGYDLIDNKKIYKKLT